MLQTNPLTGQCPHCGAAAQHLRYHSRYESRDGERRVIRCRLCRKTFCDRYGTAFYDLKTSEAKVQRAIHQVLKGLGYEAVARIEDVHPRSVHRWVERAAEQATKADETVVTNVEAEVVELDELYGFAGCKQNPEQDDGETGKHWTHCAMVRESRLLLEARVGRRTLEEARELVEGAAARLVPECRPLWCSDGLESYVEAVLSVFFVIIHFMRTGRRGRPRSPRRVPDPRLRYGQVIKQHSGRRLVGITKRVVFGVEELIPLAQISTSLLERLNGTLRLHVSPMRRKTRAFAKCRHTLDLHVTLFKSYYNLCLAHGSLGGRTPAQTACHGSP
jgi:transposase-like protein/IS1 family transposase